MYILKKKIRVNKSKYLVFDSTDENKEELKKMHRTLGWD